MKEQHERHIDWIAAGRVAVDAIGWSGTASKIRLVKFLKTALESNSNPNNETLIREEISRAKSSAYLYGITETITNIGIPIYAGFLYLDAGVPVVVAGLLTGAISVQKANHAAMARNTEAVLRSKFAS